MLKLRRKEGKIVEEKDKVKRVKGQTQNQVPKVPDHKAGPLFEKIPPAPSAERQISPWLVVYTRVGLSLGFLLVIILLNALMVLPLFSGGWTTFRDSFEGALLAQANFIHQNFPKFSWNPQWFGGYPFYLFYTPVLPFLLALLKAIFGFLSFSSIYRILMGLSFILSPVFLYIFVKYLTRKELPAILAALFYTAPIQFFFFFISSLREDITQYGNLSWGLISLQVHGQGPHIFALSLVPLTCLFYLHSLKYPALKYYVITAILIALVGLIHGPSLYGLLIMLGVLLFSEILLGQTLQKLKTAFWLALLGIGFVSVWLNPLFLGRALRVGEGAEVLSNLSDLLPLSFVVLPIAVTVLFLIFDRRPRLQPLLVSFLWFAIFGSLILLFNFGGKKYLPNPNFFIPELNLATGLFLGVALTLLLHSLLRLLRRRLKTRVFQVFNLSLYVFLVGIFIYTASLMLPKAHQLTKGEKREAVEKREEYLVSQFLKEKSSGGKVFVAGRNSLWLNVFTNLSQVKGYSVWGAPNTFWENAAEEIEKGKDLEKALQYLTAFGVEQIAVDSFHFAHPEKFAGLEELGKIGETVIYRIPYDKEKAIKLTRGTAIENLPTDPSARLTSYREIMEESKGVPWQTEDSSRFSLAADFEEGEVAILPLTYEAGWQATSKNNVLKTSQGPWGFLMIAPPRAGFWQIQLNYKPPLLVYFGYGVALLTLFLTILAFLPQIRRKVEEAPPHKGELILPEPIRDLGVTPELEVKHQEIKEHYRKTPDVDWVEKTDNFVGLETYFHRNREALVLKLYEEFGEGKPAIDLGCGTGLLLRHLPEASVGLDINPEMITKARKNAPKSALVVADIDEIPFPPATYDVAIASEVLDRLPEPSKAIKEIERVLKPGGVVIGTVAKHNPLWRLQFLSRSEPNHHPYRKEYTSKELERLFRGFDIVKITPALSEMTLAFVLRKPRI